MLENDQKKPSVSDLLNDLKTVPVEGPAELHADFYSIRKGSRRDAVVRAGGILDVKKDYIEFPLTKLFYVSEIHITGTENRKPKIRIRFKDINNKEVLCNTAGAVDDRPDQVLLLV